MFTKKLRIGSYSTIVSSRKQPSFEKIAALVFPQQTGRRMGGDCFSGNWPQKVSPGHEFSEAIKRESPSIFV